MALEKKEQEAEQKHADLMTTQQANGKARLEAQVERRDGNHAPCSHQGRARIHSSPSILSGLPCWLSTWIKMVIQVQQHNGHTFGPRYQVSGGLQPSAITVLALLCHYHADEGWVRTLAHRSQKGMTDLSMKICRTRLHLDRAFSFCGLRYGLDASPQPSLAFGTCYL